MFIRLIISSETRKYIFKIVKYHIYLGHSFLEINRKTSIIINILKKYDYFKIK